jgi:hypothetical protein
MQVAQFFFSELIYTYLFTYYLHCFVKAKIKKKRAESKTKPRLQASDCTFSQCSGSPNVSLPPGQGHRNTS